MAPVASAVLGSEVTVLAKGELALIGTLTAFSVFLLISVVLLLLCASCQGQKKGSGPTGDHENLMNGVSEKETCSQSAESHGTDLACNSSHDGPVTSGTVLTDTMDSPQASEDMLSSQSEIRSSKYHQDRELPSIPPTDALNAAVLNGEAAPGDGTYEVVKDAASRDVSAEDSLYETVKELKDVGLPNGTLNTEEPAAPLVNSHPSPATPDRSVLPDGVEYASVNLSKKIRNSTDMEARRSAAILYLVESEEDKPPPVPDKVLDENDNQQIQELSNGQLNSSLLTSELQDNMSPDDDLSEMYSKVVKAVIKETDHDYSSIAEIKGLVPESTSSDLYATVRDEFPIAPGSQSQEELTENGEPGYESIKIPKAVEETDQSNGKVEPDYESVGELDLNKEISRL
nr:phosphoprotein associated with glycosphingolipid-enriched microdomains 1 [Misgurnus anguillicaudatus]XP_055075735.1 phosphoprotein associated with glycosphingolipid-enriched microdomains 1 [Misgurnus anguillicaudatus]XP_055075736.1 phosphoprotein associated with glycosphingolipid-enriched microdomains 1 [Misgurnus anguillicaudatus]